MGISHAKNDTIADWTGTVTVGNTSGGTDTVAATDLVRPSDWNSAHLISLSTSDVSGLLGNGPAGQYEPFFVQTSVASNVGAGTWFLAPFFAPAGLNSGRLNYFVTLASSHFMGGTTWSAATSGTASKYYTFYDRRAIYQRGAGANSTRLESVWSRENQHIYSEVNAISTSTTASITVQHTAYASIPSAWDSAGNQTFMTTSQSGSRSTTASTAASSFANSLVGTLSSYIGSGAEIWMGFNTSLPPGQYWMALGTSSSSSTTGTNYGQGTVVNNRGYLAANEGVNTGFQQLGRSINDISAAMNAFVGRVGTSSASAFSTLGPADILATSPSGRIYWNFVQDSGS